MGDLSRVNTNVAALRAFFTLTDINDKILQAQRKISTGVKVNTSSDDPAIYYAIKQNERDVAALANKELNIERGVDLLQTNSSKLDMIAQILLEMYTLANTANAGGVSSAERQAIQTDIIQLQSELEQILLSGVSAKIYSGFTIGGLENVSLTGSLPTLSTLNIERADLVVTGSTTETTITNITDAMDSILKNNLQVGSWIRRLDFEMKDAQAEKADLISTLSTIRDADIAEEQLELTKLQILQQTALAMLAQANVAPQSILVLFQ